MLYEVFAVPKLSKRQQMIFDFIQREVHERGYPPSVREIAQAVGLASSSTVHGHLKTIEQKGYIRRNPTKPRAIELLQTSDVKNGESTEKETTNILVPLVGKVTAGKPITAIENIEEYVQIPQSFTSTDQTLFVLEVEGDSMIDAGILDGDKVIVKQQSTAENGEIVVAMTEDDEATVKRFYKEEDYIRLQPENKSLEPIMLSHVTILGKVIGLYRNF